MNYDKEDWEGIEDYDPTSPDDVTGDDYEGCGDSWCNLCGNVDNGIDHECDYDE